MKTFYVTTPIYYVNGDPHIGNNYPTIAADIIARYKRFNKEKVFFLTGTDEHGEKAELSAQKNKMSTKKYCDMMAKRFKTAFKKLNISYDRFIRTTDKDHKETAINFYKKVFAKGDIYKGFYEGLYCVGCEGFKTKKDLIDGKCPDHQKKPKVVKEETLFFKMSKYQKRLINHIKKNPDFIQPKIRRNEILSFLKKPLHDLSISRTSFNWGIKIPNQKNHIIYVWFDALINYLTAVNYPKSSYKKIWPANFHIVGKEINRFHTITWPIMLMSAGVELPKTVFAHGWWTVDGQKMSKTIGNTVYPIKLCEKYGVSVDCIRYVLFRQMPFGNDGDFSESAFVERINNELADTLGNLMSRSLTLFKKYNNSKVPKGIFDKKLFSKYKKLLNKYHTQINKLDYHTSLNLTFEFIQSVNKYITDSEPWVLAKKDEKKLNNVLFTLAQSINSISALIYPFMPETSTKIDNQLGCNKNYNIKFNNVKFGTKTNKGSILFPKIQLIKKEEKGDYVKFEDFKKIELRTAKVLEVEDLSDKLYKLTVMADKKRTLVAGVKEYYNKSDLLGKTVIIIINLEPRKIRGVLSEGMMLVAEKGKKISFLTPEKEMPENSKIL